MTFILEIKWQSLFWKLSIIFERI